MKIYLVEDDMGQPRPMYMRTITTSQEDRGRIKLGAGIYEFKVFDENWPRVNYEAASIGDVLDLARLLAEVAGGLTTPMHAAGVREQLDALIRRLEYGRPRGVEKGSGKNE